MSNTGKRPPDYIHAIAVNRLEDLIMQAIPWPRILAILSEEGLTESEDTAKRWRAEVRRRLAAEDADLRPMRKDVWRGRLEQQYHEVLAKARATKSDHAFAMLHAEATRIAKVAIVLDGMHTPVVARTDSAAPDVRSMSPLDRETEIARLLDKRRAAEAAARERGN